MVATFDKYHAKGYDMLAVAMSYDPPSYVVNYTETRKLPFQVAIDNTKTIYGQTTPICFEGWALVIVDYLFSPCFVPKTNNLLISTNG